MERSVGAKCTEGIKQPPHHESGCKWQLNAPSHDRLHQGLGRNPTSKQMKSEQSKKINKPGFKACVVEHPRAKTSISSTMLARTQPCQNGVRLMGKWHTAGRWVQCRGRYWPRATDKASKEDLKCSPFQLNKKRNKPKKPKKKTLHHRLINVWKVGQTGQVWW